MDHSHRAFLPGGTGSIVTQYRMVRRAAFDVGENQTQQLDISPCICLNQDSATNIGGTMAVGYAACYNFAQLKSTNVGTFRKRIRSIQSSFYEASFGVCRLLGK